MARLGDMMPHLELSGPYLNRAMQPQPALQPHHRPGPVDSFNNQFNLHPNEQIPLEPVKIDSVVNAGGRTRLLLRTPGGLSNSWRSWTNWMDCSSQVSLPFGRYNLVPSLIATLIFLILLNLVLFVWIVTSLRLHQTPHQLSVVSQHQFNAHGRAQVQVDGVLSAKGMLYSNSVRSVSSGQLHIESPEGENSRIQFVHTDPASGLEESIILADDHIELKTSNLLVHWVQNGAQSHRPVMQLTASQLMLDDQVSQLRSSAGGLRITQQLNNSSLQANSIHDLRIESRNEQLKLTSERAIDVEAINGQVRASGHSGVVMHSARNGTLVLDSAKVQMTHFKQYHHHHQLMHQRNRYHDQDQDQQQTDQKKKMVEPIAYQLCICGDGNMFIADAHNMCEADLSICAN